MKLKSFALTTILSCLVAISCNCLDAKTAPKKHTKKAATKNVNIAPSADSAPIAEAIAALNSYASLQKSLHIQDADLSFAMRKALLLSQLLIRQDGQLNLSMCQAAQAAFVPQNPLKYEINISHVLNQLDSSWQPFFDRVVKPSDTIEAANALLRAIFGLQSNEEITDYHAKVAVLAAMLSPFNQGPVGDCFAVADLVRDHEEYFKHSAKDYAQVVMHGYISRLIDHSKDNFFFVPVLADGDLANVITVDSLGKVQGTDVLLLDAPGFQAASDVMGGNQVSNLVQNVLGILFNGNITGSVKVSAQQVVEALAQAISTAIPNADKNVLLANGLYAFSALTNNAVLRATECAFSAMAEDRPQDYIRGNTNACVAKALQDAWEALQSNPQTNAFQKAFADKFNASYRFVYNPSIPLAQVSSDGSSSEGGFQLYKRIADNPELIGIRVETPDDFKTLVLDTIAATEVEFGASAQVSAITLLLNQFVQNPIFLKNAFWVYNSQNLNEKDPITNYLSLASTPMQSCDGDNPYEVINIDTGQDDEKDVMTYTPKNPLDLIKWCLELSKEASNQLFPMNSPQHAFNYDPTNADIMNFVKSGKKSDYWIRHQINVPCIRVATKQIDTNLHTSLSNYMYTVLQEVLPDEYEYQEMVNKLAATPLTVQKYAQNLLNGILKLIQLEESQISEVARFLDAELLRVLPAYERTILQQNAIRFAFTNWNNGTKNIYFCAFFNPRTLQISFGTIDEDKTNLVPMDEAAWVNNQQWDVDLSAYAPPDLLMVTRYNF